LTVDLTKNVHKTSDRQGAQLVQVSWKGNRFSNDITSCGITSCTNNWWSAVSHLVVMVMEGA